MFALLRARLWMIKNAVLTMTYGDALKALGFSALGGMLLLLLYAGFMRLLFVLGQTPLVGPLLTTKLMAMAFLATFLMLIFSSVLASFTTLFFSRDLSFLMLSPLRFRTVFMARAVETGAYSSWMVVAAMLPFLAAYGAVRGVDASFYWAAGLLSAPFIAVACLLGILVSLTLMCLFPAQRVREVMLTLAILAGGTLYVLFRAVEPERLVRADSFEWVVQYVALLEAPVTPMLPSWWMTAALRAFEAGKTAEAWRWTALLAGTAALLAFGLAMFAEYAYHGGWTSAQESSRRRIGTALGREWRWIPAAGRMRALLGKDALAFVRDTNQWSQFLLLAALMAVYLMSIAKLPLDTPYLKWLIAFLNLGMVGFVTAAVALRLVFPAISLEGRSWWVLRASPMGLWSVLWEKFALGFLPLAALSLILVTVSNRLLKMDAFVGLLSSGAALLMAAAIAGLAVGYGSLFPRFNAENVARIESSPGGVLFMLTSFAYVGGVLAVNALPLRLHVLEIMRDRGEGAAAAAWVAMAATAALSAAACWFPLAFGKLHLEKMDV